MLITSNFKIEKCFGCFRRLWVTLKNRLASCSKLSFYVVSPINLSSDCHCIDWRLQTAIALIGDFRLPLHWLASSDCHCIDWRLQTAIALIGVFRLPLHWLATSDCHCIDWRLQTAIALIGVFRLKLIIHW